MFDSGRGPLLDLRDSAPPPKPQELLQKNTQDENVLRQTSGPPFFSEQKET